MTLATQKIAMGDYTARVRISSRDEFGELAKAFSQMAESLQKLEQLRKKMMIDVAHELRTPLSNMRGYLEALSSDVVPSSKETFDTLHEEVLRLVKLVESLLQLAQADAAGITIRRQNIDLEDLCLQAIDLFQIKFEAKAISVTADLAAAGEVMADPEMISQVLRNLLENAWQYTPAGGEVRLRAECTSGRIKLTFSNTGKGIAENDLPLIFERFYRAEKSRSRDHGGAGIGLTIVKELVEAHGGEVGAESSSSETRVWFALPV
jgi:two-component system, OmpR family, sensor histidine kinase BaeS